MSHANGRTAACIVLWIADAPTWAEEIQMSLAQADYTLCIADSREDANRLLHDKRPDVLMVMAHSSDTALFDSFTNTPDTTLEPLKVLITDTAAPEQPYGQPADLVFSPDSRQIDSHVRATLRLREANRALAEENVNLKKELDALKRASSEVEILKNAIVRNVSHELKTPLLHVKSAVSLLAEDVGDTKLIQYATDATAHLEALVRNITLLGGNLDLNPGPVIVRDAVEHSQRTLRRLWQHKDEIDRVVVHLQENLPPVLVDKQGLSTVLQLLIDNALKFSKEKVEVCAEANDDRVRFSIRDYGIGIAKDQLETIFDLFYQVEHSSTRRYGGTGVGLALVRLILDHHGSQIAVDSVEGKGSTFSFTLPAMML